MAISKITTQSLATGVLTGNLFSTGSITGNLLGSGSISGNNIVGGTVTEFSSTGIEDRATVCQVTILDAGTVFENKLYAQELEVRGNTVITGDLTINGVILRDTPAYQNIMLDINTAVTDSYNRVFERLQAESLDVAKLTIGQRSIIEGSTLTNAVTESQLRRVGVLQDLQTAGETLLSQTLYSSNGRVGINTMDPTTAVSIWDGEVEISLGKLQKDTAQLSSRNSTFVISAGSQTHITMTSDGQTAVPKLRLGNISMSSSPTPPNYDADRGTVVFNENPNLGGPLGWVSLGDARWANFGIID